MASPPLDSPSRHPVSPPPPFLTKTYDMVDDPSTDDIVSWSSTGGSFVVWDQLDFSRDLLPKFFKHNNFSSFVRQLNTYGFRKSDPDRWEFANEGFVRGKRHLLNTIHRRKPSSMHGHAQLQGHHSGNGCAEVGKFEFDEGIERLKQDKHDLMMELVRLRQRQQATERDLQSLRSRVHTMEQRQQQLMTFLAKAIQNPEFLAQIVQQNDNSSFLVAANKKRRLPKQEEETVSEESNISDGQIVKYQPGISDATCYRLVRLLSSDMTSKMDLSSSSLEKFLKELEYSLAEELDGGNCTHSVMASLTGTNSSMSHADLLVDDVSGQSKIELTDSPVEFPETEEVGHIVLRDVEVSKTKSDDITETRKPKGESIALGLNLNDTAKTFSDNETNTMESAGPPISNVNDKFWEQFLTESVDGSTDGEECPILQRKAQVFFKFFH